MFLLTPVRPCATLKLSFARKGAKSARRTLLDSSGRFLVPPPRPAATGARYIGTLSPTPSGEHFVRTVDGRAPAWSRRGCRNAYRGRLTLRCCSSSCACASCRWARSGGLSIRSARELRCFSLQHGLRCWCGALCHLLGRSCAADVDAARLGEANPSAECALTSPLKTCSGSFPPFSLSTRCRPGPAGGSGAARGAGRVQQADGAALGVRPPAGRAGEAAGGDESGSGPRAGRPPGQKVRAALGQQPPPHAPPPGHSRAQASAEPSRAPALPAQAGTRTGAASPDSRRHPPQD